MNTYWQNVAAQATAILLAALGAAFITFLQTIIAQMGSIDATNVSPETAGALGAAFKATHSALTTNTWLKAA